MKVHYFYKITNLRNGKYYLGVHTSKKPEKDNYWGSGPAIKAAVRKYGKENFKKETIKTFNSQEEAFEYERKHVTLKEILDPLCYNMQIGGLGGTTGAIYMSNGRKLIRILPEQEEFYRNKGFERYRRVHSEETLQKMKESHMGHKKSKESVEKTASKVRSLIWITKDSFNLRVTPEEFEKYRKSEGWIKGRSRESIERISQSLKNFNSVHKKILRIYVNRGSEVKAIPVDQLEMYLEQGWTRGNGRKGRTMSEDTKRKLSEAGKLRKNQTSGRIWIHKGDIQKRIFPESLKEWEQEGWMKGHSEDYKQKVQKSLTWKSQEKTL